MGKLNSICLISFLKPPPSPSALSGQRNELHCWEALDMGTDARTKQAVPVGYLARISALPNPGISAGSFPSLPSPRSHPSLCCTHTERVLSVAQTSRPPFAFKCEGNQVIRKGEHPAVGCWGKDAELACASAAGSLHFSVCLIISASGLRSFPLFRIQVPHKLPSVIFC